MAVHRRVILALTASAIAVIGGTAWTLEVYGGDGSERILTVAAITFVLALPGTALLPWIRHRNLFALALIALLISLAVGFGVADSSHDAQAGLALLLTPEIGVVLGLLLIGVDQFADPCRGLPPPPSARPEGLHR